MRVALLAHRLARRDPTGVDRYTRLLTQALAVRGDLSCVAAAPHERTVPNWIPAGVDLHRIRGPRRAVHLAWSLLHRPGVDRSLGGPDLVHVTEPSFPVPCRAPLVYTIHDVMPLDHPEWFRRIPRWGFRLTMRNAAADAAALIADSEATAASTVGALGVHPDRITVVPLAADPRFLLPVTRAEIERAAESVGVSPGRFAVCVGQINDRKNVSVVVQAIARLPEPLDLVIVGSEGEGASRVRAEVERSGVGERVRFTGFVPDDTLRGLLAAARVLAHPSRKEGFGLTPLEAMAVGTPAIVATRSALPGTVREVVAHADPGDPDAWAAAIDGFGDEEHRTAVAKRGQEEARSFTWERVAAETAAVYRAVLGSANSDIFRTT